MILHLWSPPVARLLHLLPSGGLVRRSVLLALAVMFCTAVALAADDGSPPPDLSGIGGWLELALKVGVPTAGLAGVIYWLLRYHIPELTQTFRDSLKAVIDDHKATRAEDREHYQKQIDEVRNAIAAEGELNRKSRDDNTAALRATLTNMSPRQLRAADAEEREAEDAEPPTRRRSNG